MEKPVEFHASQPSLCPLFEEAMAIMSKKWNGLIIEILLQHPMRFCQLRDSIEGISDRLLIERLRELTEKGIVVKEDAINSGGNHVTTYALTPKGEALKPSFDHIHEWAMEWLVED